LAGRGQLDTTAVAIKQAAAELVFQCLDPRTGGSRREKRLARALSQAGRLGDMDEQAQVGQIEMHGGLGLLADASGQAAIRHGYVSAHSRLKPLLLRSD